MMGLLLSAALAAGPISVEQHGTLREALNVIANKGGLNLVITGDLSQPAEVVLKDVTAEEAIEAVAAAYQLEVSKQGKVWVLKPKTQAATGVAMPPVPPVPAVPQQAAAAPEHPDAVAARAEAARERAEALREQAEEAREQARDLAEARREEARAAREEAKAQAEATRAETEVAHAGEEHLVATGKPLVVKKGTRVETAVSYGGAVTVEEDAEVENDVVAFGGDVTLKHGAKVGGDAVSFGGQVHREDGATVKGEVVSMGSKTLGTTMAKGAAMAAEENQREKSGPGGVAGFLLRFAVMFGLGFVFMMFAPQRVRLLEQEIQRAPVVDGAMGALGFLALLPATVILALTLIGIPVVVLMWPLVGLVSLMGLTALANLIGARLPLMHGRKTQALVLAIGVLALLLTAAIPVVGPLVLTIAACISFGAVLRTRLGYRGNTLPVPDGVGTPTQPSV
jgi:hypothetical protein